MFPVGGRAQPAEAEHGQAAVGDERELDSGARGPQEDRQRAQEQDRAAAEPAHGQREDVHREGEGYFHAKYYINNTYFERHPF